MYSGDGVSHTVCRFGSSLTESTLSLPTTQTNQAFLLKLQTGLGSAWTPKKGRMYRKLCGVTGTKCLAPSQTSSEVFGGTVKSCKSTRWI